jgi:hypothetical protein
VAGAGALALAAACATPAEDRAAAQKSWDGATYEEVVRAWGVPTRTTMLGDDREARSWLTEAARARGVLYPSVGVSGGTGNVGVGVGMGSSMPIGEEVQQCERTLVFAGERVVEQGPWFGPDVFCAKFRRG